VVKQNPHRSRGNRRPLDYGTRATAPNHTGHCDQSRQNYRAISRARRAFLNTTGNRGFALIRSIKAAASFKPILRVDQFRSRGLSENGGELWARPGGQRHSWPGVEMALGPAAEMSESKRDGYRTDPHTSSNAPAASSNAMNASAGKGLDKWRAASAEKPNRGRSCLCPRTITIRSPRARSSARPWRTIWLPPTALGSLEARPSERGKRLVKVPRQFQWTYG
jgi:hypothetical protein